MAIYMTYYGKGFFKGLIVENSFASVSTIFDKLCWLFYPAKLCLKNKWPSVERVPHIKCPSLFIACTEDETGVPVMDDMPALYEASGTD